MFVRPPAPRFWRLSNLSIREEVDHLNQIYRNNRSLQCSWATNTWNPSSWTSVFHAKQAALTLHEPFEATRHLISTSTLRWDCPFRRRPHSWWTRQTFYLPFCRPTAPQPEVFNPSGGHFGTQSLLNCFSTRSRDQLDEVHEIGQWPTSRNRHVWAMTRLMRLMQWTHSDEAHINKSHEGHEGQESHEGHQVDKSRRWMDSRNWQDRQI